MKKISDHNWASDLASYKMWIRDLRPDESVLSRSNKVLIPSPFLSCIIGGITEIHSHALTLKTSFCNAAFAPIRWVVGNFRNLLSNCRPAESKRGATMAKSSPLFCRKTLRFLCSRKAFDSGVMPSVIEGQEVSSGVPKTRNMRSNWSAGSCPGKSGFDTTIS